jgi:hypothetical protein
MNSIAHTDGSVRIPVQCGGRILFEGYFGGQLRIEKVVTFLLFPGIPGAFLFELKKMEYVCNCSSTCSRYSKIEDLYYCQGCQSVRCPICVAQDIESYYCPHCLENMASSEANSFSNRFGLRICNQ